jgi:hypothetical protein
MAPGFHLGGDMYQADRVFLKRLKELDPRLICEFGREAQRFLIKYKRPVGEPLIVLKIETENGEFRQPDNRDIEKLKKYDTHRVSLKTILDASATYLESWRSRHRRNTRMEFRDRTKEDKIQLMNIMKRITGSYKPAGTFRQVNPRPRRHEYRHIINF